jgi:HEAT repeat protein
MGGRDQPTLSQESNSEFEISRFFGLVAHNASMRKGYRVAVILVLIILMGAVAWLVLRKPEEPVYQGKPLQAWLAQYDATMFAGNAPPGLREAKREEATAALKQIGTNAIPTLLTMIRAKDPCWLVVLRRQRWLYRFVNRKRLPIPRAALNRQARWGFKVLGADAKAAVPKLIQIYVQASSPSSLTSKESAAEALGYMGSAAEEALPSLLRDATNSNIEIRQTAVLTIFSINSKPDFVVPAITKSLQDADLSVRWNTAILLGDFGERAKSAVPALTNALKDQSIREQVEIALKRIDPETAAKAGVK